ncbi:uncharacterized protein LOC133737882 [Rosa rugosa]|uniref:uncharacterized protein LOC133737882 n=1 Tax=Rosa rugosa TaxID=74645 RepID=UPI002B4065E1|nr:uncharacterized protein LOC133737882 [Rosa rugosa]
MDLSRKLGELWLREEKYWKQRSRVAWLQVGDSNSKFFHLSTIHRRQRNIILKVQTDSNEWVVGERKIRLEFEHQFQKLFSSSGARQWGGVFNGVSSIVTDEMNADLLLPFSMEEVKAATFQLGALKAPGPDGFPGLFYHKYWQIVNELVSATAVDFQAGMVKMRGLNQTHIVLIPKIPNPERTSHFRSISLCNNSYKILSKLLANRLKSILPHLISDFQNAFVPNRQIQDNILLAHEVFHYLKLKREGDNNEFGLKLDMNKAYDRVEWDFLEAALLRFGFSRTWVNLIVSCISMVSFSIVINGQLINTEKSSIYFSPNTPDQMVRLMCELLRIEVTYNPGTYLGLPTIWGRSKKAALSYIKERLLKKIEGWKQCNLSMAGRETLIKSVALAVPAYSMACFKLPKGLCNELNAALGNFWWGSNEGRNKMHWKSWDFLCCPKGTGGMGFRDLNDFNIALLARQCWRLVHNPNSLWARVLKSRYFPNCNLFEAVRGHRASWGWASLLEARDLVSNGSSWQVIDGSSINIWNDMWLSPPNEGHILSTGPIPTDAPKMGLAKSISIASDKKRMLTLVSFICWAIWKARCSFIYQHRPISPALVLDNVLRLAGEFWSANALMKPSPASPSQYPSPDRLTSWTPPPFGFSKINVDASWKPPNSSGIGVVIRNSDRSLVCASSSGCRRDSSSVEMAEARAILAGINLAIELHLGNIILESNSKNLISNITNQASSKNWRIFPLLEEIRRKSSGFENINWHWTPREANRAADP